MREQLEAIQARMADAIARAGRAPSEVRLVGVSKTVPPEHIREAALAGLTIAGESRVQELLPKQDALADLALEWHFIGNLQRNKVRQIVGRVHMVQSVHSVALARELSQRVERAGLPPLAVLAQVHIGDEATKTGLDADELLDACDEIAALPGLSLRGLMAIPPWESEVSRAARWFRQLAGLAAAGRARGLRLDELSMGMSSDFEVAIGEGATLVRVGTALFGDRPPR